jgi:purine nucleosidase
LLAGSPTVLGIGPLTNVAEAVEHPAAGIEQIYLMGGDYSRSEPEHNIKSDSTAAAAVFGSGVPVTAIGLEQTTRLRLGAAVVAEIEAAGEFGRLLGAEMRQFWKFSAADSNAPHDPAAVLMMVEPELFAFDTGRVEVDPSGLTHFTPAADGPHRIVTDQDTDRVARRIVERILAARGRAD